MNLFLEPRTLPLVIAHRGASAHAPENTLAAFVLAADQHADAIELDAKLTQDGRVVVMHDPTIDRTTDGHGCVSDLTLAEIRQFDAGAKFDGQIGGERVPLLEEVFEAVGRRLLINVELTNYTSTDDGLEAQVIELIKKHNLFDRVLLSSFNSLSLRKVKWMEPRAVCGVLYQPLNLAWLWPLIPHLDAHHPHFSMASPLLVKWRHWRNNVVNVWTVNDAHIVRALAALGVDGIIGDDPVMIRNALGNR
jgi:glycerophosphoryl diester phosphodiesterase